MAGDVRAALIRTTLALPAAAALVGSNVYPNQAPQQDGPFPDCVVVRLIGRDPTHTLDGFQSIGNFLVQFECYSTSYARAQAIASAVIGTPGAASPDGLVGFRGAVQVTGGPVNVLGVFLHDQSDDLETPIHADEIGVHNSTFQLSAWTA